MTKPPRPSAPAKPAGLFPVLLLAIILVLLFWRSFLSGFVHFSNDGPLGQLAVAWKHLPSAMFSMWDDLNETGINGGSYAPGITMGLSWLLGPIGYSKYYVPMGLILLGIGVCTFFRSLKLSPLGALSGALGMMLNSTFFTDATWGLASHEIALGMVFFALALVVVNTRETPWHIRWGRLALAGLCVGVNVMEAADIGALYSLIVAAFVFFKSWTHDEGGPVKRLVQGVSRVAVIAVFAGFIASQTILALVGTSIQGVAGAAQDTESKAQRWDWATQWSLPKKETLGIAVPGLFGYRMDTPKDMMPAFHDAYTNGLYWGGIGRDPALDRYFDSGSEGAPPPSGFMRFTGNSFYCGILVLLLAAWTVAQSLRRQHSVFPAAQKKLIWFWALVAAVSLPLAWGRFAPGSQTSDGFLFYALLYKLPYFSTIRNPDKFLFFFSWAVVILFAYGVHALSRRQLDSNAPTAAGTANQLASWWARAGGFDRKWTQICLGLFGASVLGWVIYSGRKADVIQHLQKTGFSDPVMAEQIAAFSIGQAGWFLLLFAAALALLTLVIAGCFSGARAKTGALLLGGFVLFDLGRADLPFVIHWDYKQKYEVGSLNPVVDFLAQKPYENRVAGLPFRAPQGLELFDELYRIEWTQHLFPYYNIHCLDLIQMSRMPVDLKAYLETFSPRSNEMIRLFARRWQLTNTRYLLGPAGFLATLNEQLDPGQKRFRIAQRFSVTLKPGVTEFHQRLEELTAVANPNGDYALFEFTGALPRVKLYSNWQVNTNDQAALKTLADPNFDPLQTVLVSSTLKNLPLSATNENSGTAEFKSYAPTHIVFETHSTAPAVMLLNDRYDANWQVTVDKQPAELLRCNFLMRGVQLTPGPHTVEFRYVLPNKPLYVTLSAFGVGFLLCGFLFVASRRQNAPPRG